jgi:hypothetical protein
MIKKILVPVFLLFSVITIAQQATSSPYSFYGIGDIRFKGATENRLMGGLSVFTDSIHVNLQNPASYSSLKLATFSIGAAFNSTKINSYQGDDKAQRTTLDYMSVGLPIGRFGGVALGLVPYSAVGYRISNTTFSTEDGEVVRDLKKYQGQGGLNKVFLGYGFQVNKNFSIGADVTYNFGNIETTNIRYISRAELGAQEVNDSDMSGLNFNIGAMYQMQYKKYDFYSSIAFTPQSKLNLTNTRTISSIQYSEDYSPGIVDQLDPDVTDSNLKLPSQLSVGLGFGQTKKWLVGTEVTFRQSNNFDNRFSDVTQATFENGMQYSFGGYFVPDYNSFSSYFKKVTYRAGFRYEKTGMVIRNESIKDYSYTGGFGFPLGGAFSNLNIGVEYGRRGTAKANLVEENYTNVIMSLSLNDRWFVKRKYD